MSNRRQAGSAPHHINVGLALVMVAVAVFVGLTVRPHSHAATQTLHYASNMGGSYAAPLGIGINVMDVTGSTSNPAAVKATIDAMPSGAMAMVWVGNLDNAPIGSSCPAPGFTTAQFQGQVDALVGDSRVVGYYISDEPHPGVCPNAAADIKARADYIHAKAPTQKAFIVVLDGTNSCGGTLGCEFNALRPANTDVDLVGIDPYPCHYDGSGNPVACDLTQITSRVNAAESNGIAASVIVPVFQTFGQEGRTDGKQVYYRTPSASELSSMVSAWAGLVPSPFMDYAYSWGVQCSSSCPAPQALANHAELEAVMQNHNAVLSGSTSTPSGGSASGGGTASGPNGGGGSSGSGASVPAKAGSGGGGNPGSQSAGTGSTGPEASTPVTQNSSKSSGGIASAAKSASQKVGSLWPFAVVLAGLAALGFAVAYRRWKRRTQASGF